MFVRLLGPVELVDEAGPVRLGGDKERTALATMALARPRPVDSTRLVDALWDVDPPRTAVKSMQAYVSRLRSVVGDAITSTGTGYALHIETDVEAAERLVAEGHDHLADGAAGLAAERFADALHLWRGPPLTGVAATHPMELERTRLDELAHTTAEHRMAALLDAGHGPTLIGELEVMVGEQPLRERRWAHLLMALHRSGRQAEALRAYQRLRATLSEQLGIDPSAELQELERRILTRDLSLDAPSEPVLEAPVAPPVGDSPTATRDPPVGANPAATFDGLPQPDRIATPAGLPLPDRIATATGPFAGRRAELARLRAAWDRASTHGRRGVLVAGEPGIGKTTMVGRFAQEMHEHGAVVVIGECSQDVGIAYRPWIEALGQLVHHLPVGILAEHVDASGGVLSHLATVLGRRVELPAPIDVGPEAERYLLFGAVVDLLARTPAPLLVVLDDLHWADRASVQMLRHVMTSPALPEVLVVGAYRPTDVDPDDPLPDAIADLRRVEGMDFVSLDGLDDTELLELLGATDHQLADGGLALRDALAAETGGNPFFALEILRHLADTGALDGDGDGRPDSDPSLGLELPVSVRQVIGQRAARLGGTTHRVLREAAVIGREFDGALLAEVADVDPDELLELLDRAVAAAVIVNPEGDRFAFAHALIGHALHAELLPARRVRTHGRVARCLERRWGTDPGDRVGELAHHWAHAAAVDGPDRAILWARRAGDHAMERLAPEEAVRWYARALDLLDPTSRDQELRRVLQVGLGNAERLVGDPAHRRRLLDAAHLALRAGDVDVLVEAALANNGGIYSTIGDVDQERVAVLEAALAAVHDTDDRSRARLLATLSAELVFSGSSRPIRLATEAVDAARRCGDGDTLCDVLNLTEIIRRAPWLLDERDRCTLEALDLSARSGDPVRRFDAVLKRHHLLLVRGERAEARRHFDEAASIADRLGLPTLVWIVRTNRVLEAVLDGDLERAEDRATSALELGTSGGQAEAFTLYSIQLMNIRHHQGRLDELVPAISRFVADKPGVATFRAVLAYAHARSGRADRARPLLAELTDDLDGVATNSTWSTHMGLLADTAIDVGDHDVAADLYERLAPYGDQIGTIVGVVCDGAISHRLGRLARLLGRRDDAVEHLTDALARHRRLESPLHVAATEAELARITA